MSLWGSSYHAKRRTCEVTTSDVYTGKHNIKTNDWVTLQLSAARAPKVSLFDGISNISLPRGFWRVTVCSNSNVLILCDILVCNVTSANTQLATKCKFYIHVTRRQERFWHFTRVVNNNDDVQITLQVKKRNTEGSELNLKITVTIKVL